MTYIISDYANEAPAAAAIGNLNDFLVPEESQNPIDDFRGKISEIVQAATPKKLEDSPMLGRLLLVEIISTTERYFRQSLARAIEVCPLCHELALEKNVNLGGMIWHGLDKFSHGAFENASFTSKKEIKSSCKEYIGLNLDEAKFSTLLINYDLACQFRHGVVHNAGYLPGKNAVALGIERSARPLRISPGFAQIQSVADVCSVLTAAINREIFDLLCKRWAIDWRKRPDWRNDRESITFRRIWSDFHCKKEAEIRTPKREFTASKCMSKVRLQYGI